MSVQGMSIGELADVLEVSVATVRSWEQRYRWPRSQRTNGGHRRYRRNPALYVSVRDARRSMPTKQALKALKLI